VLRALIFPAFFNRHPPAFFGGAVFARPFRAACAFAAGTSVSAAFVVISIPAAFFAASIPAAFLAAPKSAVPFAASESAAFLAAAVAAAPFGPVAPVKPFTPGVFGPVALFKPVAPFGPIFPETVFGVTGSGLCRPPLFAHLFFQYPQRFIKTLEKILKIIGKKNHRLPIKAALVAVFAFYNVKVKIAQAVLLNIEKIRPVLQYHPCRKKFTPQSHKKK
jgi:hypothetical protein